MGINRANLAMLFGVLAAVAGCASGRGTEQLPAVTGFDAERYLGVWHEVARLPHRFERGMDQVTAEYSLNPDGSIDVVNRGVREGEPHSVHGVAKFKGDPTVGELRVSFFRPFYGDYRIILLDPEYRWAVVTGDSMDYLWILSRSPVLPETQLQSLLEFARSSGFPVERLEYPKP